MGDGFLFQANKEYEDVKKALVNVHGEYLLASEIERIIFIEAFQFEKTHQGRHGSLSSSENADLRELLIEELCNFFDGLPYKYELRIELPAFPAIGSYEIKITEGIKLVAGEHAFHLPESFQNQLVNALRRSFPEQEARTFLLFEFTGYARADMHSPAIESSISLLKQLAFILSTHSYWEKGGARSQPARATLTTLARGTTVPLELPHDLAILCGALKPNVEKLTVADEGGTTLLTRGRPRPAATDLERIEALEARMYEATQYFGRKNHLDFASLAASIEWYQDSVLATNQTFGYLAACIGLEALLGSDENLDTLSKRLEDRYAFLMGKGRAERESMRAEYRAVLNLRGKLVHARAAHLKAEYRESLGKVQRMLLNLIWKEFHQLLRATA